ncbi:MAG: CCDC90 family protein [Desulfovibrionaceae bacterium]|nr:CCDC90 family protein [Desulfovibrionaceae bacterium]
MSAVPLTFDTLAYVKQLEAVGVPREQAEVQAHALRQIIDEKLATKMDIAQVRAEAEANKQELKRDIMDVRAEAEANKQELKRDIMDVRAEAEANKQELKHDIAGIKRDMLEMENRWMHQVREMESRIVIRLGGMLIAAVGVIIAVLKL